MRPLRSLLADPAYANVMIDLETMGIRPTSAIVSIGAVHFNHEGILSKFYTTVSLRSCIEAGLTTDLSTIDWWAKQSPEARAAWQTPDAPELLDALKAFSDWVRSLGQAKVRPWGNGVDFDIVLMNGAYRAIDADPPWKYYHHMCFRTVRSLYPVQDIKRHGTHHHALDDAISQAQVLQMIVSVYESLQPPANNGQ